MHSNRDVNEAVPGIKVALCAFGQNFTCSFHDMCFLFMHLTILVFKVFMHLTVLLLYRPDTIVSGTITKAGKVHL